MWGWQIVQQLEQKKLDSWERIHAAFQVKDPNDGMWDDADDRCAAGFSLACPLLGEPCISCVIHLHEFVAADPVMLVEGRGRSFGHL